MGPGSVPLRDGPGHDCFRPPTAPRRTLALAAGDAAANIIAATAMPHAAIVQSPRLDPRVGRVADAGLAHRLPLQIDAANTPAERLEERPRSARDAWPARARSPVADDVAGQLLRRTLTERRGRDLLDLERADLVL